MSAAPFLFVHSDVDDAGLTAPQFRLLAHLARRAGADGLIYSGIENMVTTCRLEKKTVRAALRMLEQRNIVVTVYRPGLTPHRSITPVSDWKADPTQTATLPERLPYPKDGSTPHPNGTPSPHPNGYPKVYPLKGIQEKVIHKEAGASKAKRFKKPSIEELKEYGKEIGLPDDRVVAFFDYQESKGWKVGTTPMEDWRAALRSWKSNSKYSNPPERHGVSLASVKATGSTMADLEREALAKINQEMPTI